MVISFGINYIMINSYYNDKLFLLKGRIIVFGLAILRKENDENIIHFLLNINSGYFCIQITF